ncbi:hypothetical protein GMORB2_7015 [Geosmithia morbida]|uniref:Uncharacterized protein n=1 Tax=Geosmithia morbida TaxID=1094350 RepID=A0A9P4YTA2_9HYPO|nr:uncharacterized protein GMORB2_7015 [Geosmithia morbida]KAF4122708.1 hypothetical protein GMORB2_7015 [Geosmithia morbida]
MRVCVCPVLLSRCPLSSVLSSGKPPNSPPD